MYILLVKRGKVRKASNELVRRYIVRGVRWRLMLYGCWKRFVTRGFRNRRACGLVSGMLIVLNGFSFLSVRNDDSIISSSVRLLISVFKVYMETAFS